MIGSGDVIGVAPAPEYTFRILVTPVGPYFKGGLKPVKLRVSEYDRAAPHGTGNIKAGLNYAMSLKPTMEAHRGAMPRTCISTPSPAPMSRRPAARTSCS